MMPPLGELDVNAPRPKLYKQATLESFTGGKHARLSSSGSTDDFYTSGPESTRVHPSSQTDEERPLKKRLRRTHAATDSSDDEDDIPRVLLPSQRRLPSQINAATFLARRGIAPANALAALTRQRGACADHVDRARWLISARSLPIRLHLDVCLQRYT
jgi:hypothetical protein